LLPDEGILGGLRLDAAAGSKQNGRRDEQSMQVQL
jgi:hypothetical protein